MKDGEQVRKGSSMEMDIMDDSGYEGCWSRLWVRRSDFVKMIGSDDAFICPSNGRCRRVYRLDLDRSHLTNANRPVG